MSGNLFSRFYDTEVSIVRVTKGGGYSSRGKETTEELCTVKADVQPYGGELAAKEYGIDIECRYRMFCDANENITEGNYVVFAGKRYKIVYTTKRKFGMTAVLQLVKKGESI